MKVVLDYAFYFLVVLMRRGPTSKDDIHFRAAALMCLVFGWWVLGLVVVLDAFVDVIPENVNRFAISVPLLLVVGTITYRYYITGSRAERIESHFGERKTALTTRLLAIGFLAGAFIFPVLAVKLTR